MYTKWDDLVVLSNKLKKYLQDTLKQKEFLEQRKYELTAQVKDFIEGSQLADS